jgi:hypothetical protein
MHTQTANDIHGRGWRESDRVGGRVRCRESAA